MRKLIKAIKRLWVIGTCDHYNAIEFVRLSDVGPTINVCTRCGRVIDGLPYDNEAAKYKGITC
jgi:hypothetical protein